MADTEFQVFGAVKVTERSPKDFRFRFGIFDSVSFKVGKSKIFGGCRELKKDTGVKTLVNGGRPG